jgi:hypothetical protein
MRPIAHVSNRKERAMNHTYQPAWLAALDAYRASLRQRLRKVFGHV